MPSLVRQHWFLLTLIAVLTLGLTQGASVVAWTNRLPRDLIVGVVMFLTALPMQFRQITSTLRRWDTTVLALALNVAVAPPLAWLVGHVLPAPLAIGLVIAAAVPCTLASAAVWTRRGGGNDAIALMVTLVTNLACFAVMPFWIWMLLQQEVDLGERDASNLSLRLLLLVVVPVAVAQLLRRIPVVAVKSTEHKLQISIAAQIGLLMMVLIGSSAAGAKLAELAGSDSSQVGWSDWLLMVLSIAVVHLGLFAAGWWGGRLLGQKPADRLAVAIAGSQKTLMIGLYVAMSFGGLAVLPMVGYHVLQLVIDTLLVDWLRPCIIAEECDA